ncbi:DUF4189 domain-containing protein [Sphingomonas sp. HF-S3]|uniref:DUF4189 domain-containing protein n=1 Tax=Sphingomonas rustica TaxID=3103142 RepID=A0ABV0BBC4_9SPHN
MKKHTISSLSVAAALVLGLSVLHLDSASAQRQTVFICNGVAQGSPNCAPPTPVLKRYIHVDRSFGALAYDEAKAAWYGSYQYPSKSAAQKGVLEHCRENGGATCKLMLSYTNQCAAVTRVVEGGAEARGKDSVNTGSTQDEAEANAIRSCQADWGVRTCTVKLVNCSHHNVTRWSRWEYE